MGLCLSPIESNRQASILIWLSVGFAVKRLSIEISDSLHREAKLAAMMDGCTLSSLVIDLLDAHLKARRAAQPHPMRRMSDFNPGVVREASPDQSA